MNKTKKINIQRDMESRRKIAQSISAERIEAMVEPVSEERNDESEITTGQQGDEGAAVPEKAKKRRRTTAGDAQEVSV
jgi:hypothetical protein